MGAKHFFATLGLLITSVVPQTKQNHVAAQTLQAVSARMEASQRQKLYRSKARALNFVAADETATELTLTENPVMTWTGLGGWSGDVFVWTGKGRIQIVGCIGSQQIDQTLKIFQEFHSLADEPIEDLELSPSVTWQIPASETKFLEIHGAPQPAPTAARRLVQLRSLARKFSVGMQVTTDNVEKSLRLLPQPLARESGGGGDVIDSALFTFVSSSGTDPEVFLLLEARRIEGELRWTYMPARFTTRAVWMSIDGVEVWRVTPIDGWESGPRLKVPYLYRDESTTQISAIAG